MFTFSAGQGEIFSLLIRHAPDSLSGLFSEVCGEADQIEVLVDVVHDFGLEESLGGIIHDFVGQFGLGNVLPQLFNTGTFGRRTIFVNDFVAFPLGGLKNG